MQAKDKYSIHSNIQIMKKTILIFLLAAMSGCDGPYDHPGDRSPAITDELELPLPATRGNGFTAESTECHGRAVPAVPGLGMRCECAFSIELNGCRSTTGILVEVRFNIPNATSVTMYGPNGSTTALTNPGSVMLGPDYASYIFCPEFSWLGAPADCDSPANLNSWVQVDIADAAADIFEE